MVQASDAVVPSPGPLPKGMRMTLRLDDGTTIRSRGDGAAEVLKPRESYEAGLLSEVHLLRVQALLCQVHAKLPDEGPLKSLSLSSKRSAETVIEALDLPAGKRLHGANGVAHHTPEAEPASVFASPASVVAAGAIPSPVAAAPIAPPVLAEAFGPRCLAMVDKVVTALGGPKDAAALGFTVAVDARLVPDYYTIVKNPIHLGEIRNRLRKSTYPSAVEFYNDMHLLFDNCFLYNPAGTGVHRLGAAAEATFEREWARSPFAALVPPRPIATQAYESVNSYRAYTPLPADKQATLADALQDESVLAAKMQGVVDILQRAGELPTNEDGEVELDLGVLSPGTVWALYEHVIGPADPRPAAGARPTASGGFQLAEDSDDAPGGRGRRLIIWWGWLADFLSAAAMRSAGLPVARPPSNKASSAPLLISSPSLSQPKKGYSYLSCSSIAAFFDSGARLVRAGANDLE
ncbi:hypothetical protein QBZ16_002019 [Prototheca wickerhamii]|uniref:Bromo domain-containing protein n=1 Tax=Prototheca wickerhamii TaxID=3111 RepID=A0AAD9IJD2_PROWI|nr:hypothetical protein QBZ16_002019 [Prototheca wickerhamii]